MHFISHSFKPITVRPPPLLPSQHRLPLRLLSPPRPPRPRRRKRRRRRPRRRSVDDFLLVLVISSSLKLRLLQSLPRPRLRRTPPRSMSPHRWHLLRTPLLSPLKLLPRPRSRHLPPLLRRASPSSQHPPSLSPLKCARLLLPSRDVYAMIRLFLVRSSIEYPSFSLPPAWMDLECLRLAI